jgi:hypothetical protein
MSIQLGETIQYEAKDLEASSYTHMKLVPLSGSQSLTVTPTSGQPLTFEVPVQAINFARSYFYADVSIALVAAKYIYAHQGSCPWSAVQLFTRGGQYLCNLQANANDYCRIVSSSDSRRSELQSGSSEEPLYTEGDALSLVGSKGATGSVAAPYREQSYLKVGPSGAALTYQIMFPMKMIRESVLALNKSINFREVLVIKFQMAKGQDIAFTGDAAADPDDAPVALATDITYTNIALYVAQERNAEVVSALNAQTSSDAGFSLLVPYPTLFTNIRTGTSQNVSLRLNKSHGSSLKAVKSCLFYDADGDKNTNLRYDRDNTANTRITSYYTNVNNNRMTEFDINTSRDEDFMVQRQKLMDSPALNKGVYKLNWFHEDRFDDYQDKKSDLMTTDTNILSGINLNQEIQYDAFFTTANASHRHVSIVHGQKLLNINNRGLVIN